MLVGCLTFTEYGETLLLKVVAWVGVAMMSLCIVASRKHYSVDVVVAWYVVPLVFYAMMRRWTTVRPPRDYWPHRPMAVEEDLGPLSPKEDINALEASNKGNKPLLPVVTVPVEKFNVEKSTNGVGPGQSRHNTSSSYGGGVGGLGSGGGVGGHSRRVSSSAALRDLEMQGLLENADDREQDTPKNKAANVTRENDGSGGVCAIM